MSKQKNHDFSPEYFVTTPRKCLNCNNLTGSIYIRYCEKCWEKIKKELNFLTKRD